MKRLLGWGLAFALWGLGFSLNSYATGELRAVFFKKISSNVGRRWLTETETGISSAKRILGRSIQSDADFQRFLSLLKDPRIPRGNLVHIRRDFREFYKGALLASQLPVDPFFASELSSQTELLIHVKDSTPSRVQDVMRVIRSKGATPQYFNPDQGVIHAALGSSQLQQLKNLDGVSLIEISALVHIKREFELQNTMQELRYLGFNPTRCLQHLHSWIGTIDPAVISKLRSHKSVLEVHVSLAE